MLPIGGFIELVIKTARSKTSKAMKHVIIIWAKSSAKDSAHIIKQINLGLQQKPHQQNNHQKPHSLAIYQF